MIRRHRFRHAPTALALIAAACTAPAVPIAAPGPAPAAPVAPVAPAAAATATLINASTTAAYNAGVYDGFITVGELRARGDFGLGATDKNDGEMTVLDGVYYRARVDGTVSVLRDDEVVPLASVTAFHPDRRLHLTGPLTRAALEARLEEWLPEANRMFAIRIHGRFSHIAAGSTNA
jgi:acetolactate decarboxylase